MDGKPLETELERYVKERNRENTLIVNIESVPAMENLDAILEVPDLDGVLIGPHDLSTSLGIPEQYQHPAFLKAVESILSRARSKGVGAGIHFWGTLDEQMRLFDLGANLLVHKADAIFFRTALVEDMAELRKRLGDKPVHSEDGSVTI